MKRSGIRNVHARTHDLAWYTIINQGKWWVGSADFGDFCDSFIELPGNSTVDVRIRWCLSADTQEQRVCVEIAKMRPDWRSTVPFWLVENADTRLAAYVNGFMAVYEQADEAGQQAMAAEFDVLQVALTEDTVEAAQTWIKQTPVYKALTAF